jgi:hypothetical protein
LVDFYSQSISNVMSYKVQCNKHKKITFTIPKDVSEAKELNSFPEMRDMAEHLREYPKCKMLRVKDYE